MIDTANALAPPGAPADEELLARVLGGDRNAYEGIMRRHNQRLYRLARSIVTIDAEAMDVLQDAYIVAYARLSELREPAALGTWLARIVRNAALMHLRRNRRYQPMDEPEVEKILTLSRLRPQPAQPERELANAQLGRVLEKCIDELPEAFRSVFVLRAVEHCSVSDVATILELKEATVKTRFHRARNLLQKRLLEYGGSGSVAVHEFAGDRCDALVRRVLERLAASAGTSD